MSDTRHQFYAFMAVVVAMLTVCVLPVLASWQLGVSLPDGLLSISDKGITAFGTLLGTIGGLMFRQNGNDQKAAEAALKDVRPVEVVNTKANPVPTEAE